MQRLLPQRIYSGAVRGEVVIQGDLSAQGDINIVIDGARTAYRTVTESPGTFGPMHTKVQDSIKTLLAVSEMTSQYLKEGRLDGNVEQQLAQLSHECRNHLVQLKNMGQEFDAMETQAFRQNDVSKLTDVLDAKARTFEDINSRVNTSLLQVEKALKKYIAQVKDGERASSIMTSISSTSTSSTLNRQEWRQIQIELESVGITVAQFNSNRARILSILSDAFKDDLEADLPVRIRKANQLTRLLSSLSSKSKELLAAAEKGNIQEVKTLLSRGAYIDTQDSNGFTPLSLAVGKQDFRLAELCLSYKADVNKRANPTQASQSPLIRAIKHGSMELISLLLNHGAGIDAYALQIATEMRDTEPLRRLISCQPKVELSSLMEVASRVGNENALRLLVEDIGVDVNASTRVKQLHEKRFLNGAAKQRITIEAGEETPVWLAAAAGHHKSVDLLLAKGADIGKYVHPLGCNTHGGCLFVGNNVEKCTALQIAVSHGHWQCARLLVRRGGDINATMPSFVLAPTTLLHHVLASSWRAGGMEKVRLLAEMGADLDVKDNLGRTPLHGLFRENRADEGETLTLARLLVANGAKVNARDKKGKTPLHLAITGRVGVFGRSVALIDMLLENGADPNAKKRNGGQTPLHFAGDRGDKRVFTHLVRAGGKADMPDHEGKTAQDRMDIWRDTAARHKSVVNEKETA